MKIRVSKTRLEHNKKLVTEGAKGKPLAPFVVSDGPLFIWAHEIEACGMSRLVSKEGDAWIEFTGILKYLAEDGKWYERN